MDTNKNIDSEIGRIMKKDLPMERTDQWFVKKVMNRLPEKRKPIFSRSEIISFIVTALVLIVAAVWKSTSVINTGYATLYDIIVLCCIATGVMLLLGYITIPVLKRS